jgi:hypothetical protein
MDQHLGGDPNAPTSLATPARNRYFYGKLLDVPHFYLEQSYLNGKRWLMNRLVSGTGIVCGLAVVPTADGTGLIISPGVAIDAWGREIRPGSILLRSRTRRATRSAQWPAR